MTLTPVRFGDIFYIKGLFHLVDSFLAETQSVFTLYTAKTLYRKFGTNNPRNETLETGNEAAFHFWEHVLKSDLLCSVQDKSGSALSSLVKCVMH